MTDMTTGAWAIVELMGHRRLGGRVTDVELFGTRLILLEVPDVDGAIRATQYYSPAALYCLTPCDEDTARKAANPYGARTLELDPVEGDHHAVSFDDDEFDDGGF